MGPPPEGRRAALGRLSIALTLLGVAGVGWWRHSIAFASFGVMALCVAGAMRMWQRHCLDGVEYSRSLSTSRSLFGEELLFSTELTNDKLLPLAWIETRDEVPVDLAISGVSLDDDPTSARRFAVTVAPILPYQRVRRNVQVTANRRGRFEFGPGRIRSGDPAEFHTQERSMPGRLELLVFPKIFELTPPRILPQVLLGEQRTRALLQDPSRVAGNREYRPGDPIRYVDWRASARSTGLLVREHEPTASLRTAVFVDLTLFRGSAVPSADLVEFTIAVAASIIAALVDEGIGVGLFGSGATVHGPIYQPPSTSPEAFASMLEMLAEASPYGPTSFVDVLASQFSRLSAMVSVVVIAPQFSEGVLSVLAARQRRGAVSTVWIRPSADVWPPLLDNSHLNFTANYLENWNVAEQLELV